MLHGKMSTFRVKVTFNIPCQYDFQHLCQNGIQRIN